MQRFTSGRGSYALGGAIIAAALFGPIAHGDPQDAPEVKVEELVGVYEPSLADASLIVQDADSTSVAYKHLDTGALLKGRAYRVEARHIADGDLASVIAPADEPGLLAFLQLGGTITLLELDDDSAPTLVMAMSVDAHTAKTSQTVVSARAKDPNTQWLIDLLKQLIKDWDWQDTPGDNVPDEQDPPTDDSDDDEGAPEPVDELPPDDTW